MRITEVSFHGYKPFPGGDNDNASQTLKLAPLTLVFGKNNSGKSALVRLPRLLLGALASDDDRILPLDVRGIKYGGRFEDIVHGGAFFRRPGFGLKADGDGETLDLSFSIYNHGTLAADEPPQLWTYSMRSPEQLEVPPPTATRTKEPRLKGLLPATPVGTRWRDAATALLDEMVYLGPKRASVVPSYVAEQPNFLGFDGREAPQWLRARSDLEEAVGAWFAENFEGWRVSLSRSNESFTLRVGKSPTMSCNLAHAGEGFQQALPVVLHQLWRQVDGSGSFLDVVEQPELHLHDAAQAPLADLFIETALIGRGQVLVETHSEPLLLRVQRRVAERKIKPEQVQIYFVDVTDEGSKVRPVSLNIDGEVDWWPRGVFEEDFQEVAAIRRAQRQRGAGVRV